MKVLAKKAGLFLLALSLVVVSAGCPNSTTILAGNGAVQVEIVNVNPSRFDDPTDGSTFNLLRILIQPLDPGAAGAAAGPRELRLVPLPIPVNTYEPSVDPIFLPPTDLSQGTYEVVELAINNIFFQDFNPTDPSTCESFQPFYFPFPAPPSDSFNVVNLASFPESPRFTISRGETTVFRLTFDLTAMVETIFNAHTCPCPTCFVVNFDPVQFVANTDNYLTFE